MVTAEKRSQNIQKVPAAVVAITGAQISAGGVVDARQFSSLVPSAQFVQVRNQVQETVRGVGQTNSSPNAEPAVATNLNGVYQLFDMTSAAFFDVDRVEVLPGPQGTLYGRSAAGGAVNIYSRRPGTEYGGNASLEYGDYNTVDAELGVNLPVTDQFRLRAAGSFQSHDGYLSDGGDDRHVGAGRLTAVYKPVDRLTITAIASLTHQYGVGDQSINRPAIVNRDDPYDYPLSMKGHFDHNTDLTVSTEVNYELTNHINLTYIGGYDHFQLHQFLDVDGRLTPTPAQQTQNIVQRGNFDSQEFRLTGDYSRLKWIGGLYYYNELQPYFVETVVPNVTTVQTPLSIHGDGYAAFGQATYSILDRLRLVGGLRYSEDHKTGFGAVENTSPKGVTIDAPFEGSVKDHRVDYKGGLEADLAPNSLGYFTVQSGYNEGGFSLVLASLPGGNEFKPEELTSYTFGVKNRFLDRRLQFNVEGYYYDYKNYQVSARNTVTGENTIYNAQKSEIYGAQIDTSFLITPEDQINLNIGLLHATSPTLVLPSSVSGRTNFDGFTLPQSPTGTVSANYQHIFALPGGATLTPRVSTYFESSRWATYNHLAGTHQNPYDKTDLQLTYAPESRKWSLQGYVRNITNVIVYDNQVATTLPGPGAGFLEPPRTYGARYSINF